MENNIQNHALERSPSCRGGAESRPVRCPELTLMKAYCPERTPAMPWWSEVARLSWCRLPIVRYMADSDVWGGADDTQTSSAAPAHRPDTTSAVLSSD